MMADAGECGARRSLLGPSLTRREAELLAITLDVLRETGYDNLTIDKVVARAHASKATVYRRWPSKSDLVAAAFAHAVRATGGDKIGLGRPAPNRTPAPGCGTCWSTTCTGTGENRYTAYCTGRSRAAR